MTALYGQCDSCWNGIAGGWTSDHNTQSHGREKAAYCVDASRCHAMHGDALLFPAHLQHHLLCERRHGASLVSRSPKHRLFVVASRSLVLCVFFVLWAYIQEIQQELEGSKFDIIGRALSGLLRWIGTIERSSSSLRTPSGHFRMCSNKNNYFK